MNNMPRIMRVCCAINPSNAQMLIEMGFRSPYVTSWDKYYYLNIYTKEAIATTRQTGMLIYTQDLEALALMPSVEVMEQYLYILQDEAAVKFKEALKI